MKTYEELMAVWHESPGDQEAFDKDTAVPNAPESPQPPVPCTPTEIAFANLIADLQREVAGLTKHRDVLVPIELANRIHEAPSQPTEKTSTREWCNCCNNYSPVSFHVPDEIWNEVTMGKFQRLCIMCFAKRADERLIDWAKDIQFFPFSLVSTDKP